MTNRALRFAVALRVATALRFPIVLLLTALLLVAAGPGFRSRRQFDEHYAKHGREFGNISQQEYLLRAQALRDAPAGGPILEAHTPDGIVSRFDRRTGSFGAYNPDRTIRTFFIPNAGERYFHRQASKRGAD
jgi:pyocin large subunit-like protein